MNIFKRRSGLIYEIIAASSTHSLRHGNSSSTNFIWSSNINHNPVNSQYSNSSTQMATTMAIDKNTVITINSNSMPLRLSTRLLDHHRGERTDSGDEMCMLPFTFYDSSTFDTAFSHYLSCSATTNPKPLSALCKGRNKLAEHGPFKLTLRKSYGHFTIFLFFSVSVFCLVRGVSISFFTLLPRERTRDITLRYCA